MALSLFCVVLCWLLFVFRSLSLFAFRLFLQVEWCTSFVFLSPSLSLSLSLSFSLCLSLSRLILTHTALPSMTTPKAREHRGPSSLLSYPCGSLIGGRGEREGERREITPLRILTLTLHMSVNLSFLLAFRFFYLPLTPSLLSLLSLPRWRTAIYRLKGMVCHPYLYLSFCWLVGGVLCVSFISPSLSLPCSLPFPLRSPHTSPQCSGGRRLP